jgi:predicted signal transduction protein with EAL and GGDEF domain
LGGDEFAIVQRGTEPVAEADALAKRVQKAIAAPFDLDGHRVVIGTSTGIAIAPGDGVDPEELLKKADLALYRVKSEARSAYRFFEPDMDRRKQALCRLEKELREALVNNEFTLEYQPLVNVEHDQLSGFEALLRWKHPARGNIPPSDFIPLAEQTGVIVAIGEWVLRQACKEAATWPHHLKVAVNVSAAQFKSRDLLGLVVQTLADSGIASQRLELEITEPAVLQEGALETLNRLHDLGVRIALDDFGTGHSSLSSLRKFAFDTIKIDRSFIHALSSAKVDALAVVRSIAHLGVSLGVCTTAEGVETQEQMDQVRAEGCTEMQGFLLSRPLPAGEIARLLFPSQRHKSASAA